MPTRLIAPDSETISRMPAFAALGPAQVSLVQTAAQARLAAQALQSAEVWGFDTESKPTFQVGEVSQGPHVVQLASSTQAWVFQLQDAACSTVVAELLALPVPKVGFGLGDDCKRIRRRLGVEPVAVQELNVLLRARGYRHEMGVKAAVAVLFGQRFAKSKKAATSNWAQATLSPAQLLYAANDAYAALRVWQQLQLTLPNCL